MPTVSCRSRFLCHLTLQVQSNPKGHLNTFPATKPLRIMRELFQTLRKWRMLHQPTTRNISSPSRIKTCASNSILGKTRLGPYTIFRSHLTKAPTIFKIMIHPYKIRLRYSNSTLGKTRLGPYTTFRSRLTKAPTIFKIMIHPYKIRLRHSNSTLGKARPALCMIFHLNLMTTWKTLSPFCRPCRITFRLSLSPTTIWVEFHLTVLGICHFRPRYLYQPLRSSVNMSSQKFLRTTVFHQSGCYTKPHESLSACLPFWNSATYSVPPYSL